MERVSLFRFFTFQTTCFFISLAFWDWKTSNANQLNEQMQMPEYSEFFPFSLPFNRRFSLSLSLSIFICDTCQVVTCICYCVICVVDICRRWNAMEPCVRFFPIPFHFAEWLHSLQPNGSICLLNINDGQKYLINMHHSCYLTLSRAIVHGFLFTNNS